MVAENLRASFFKQNGMLAWMVCLGMLISNMIVQGNCTVARTANRDRVRGHWRAGT